MGQPDRLVSERIQRDLGRVRRDTQCEYPLEKRIDGDGGLFRIGFRITPKHKGPEEKPSQYVRSQVKGCWQRK